MDGKMISLVKGLPDEMANSEKVANATAKGVKDQRKLEDAERYPILRSMASSLSLRRVRSLCAKLPSQP
jgi:hypothetical protein